MSQIQIMRQLKTILHILTNTDCALVPPPCRVVLAPGIDVAWDTCGTTGCEDPDGREGQLWANIITLNVSASGPGCERIIWTADIGIVRCAATLQEDGSPPTVAAEEHDAWQQAADADRIRQAIRCCTPDQSPGESPGAEVLASLYYVELVEWRALGPEGGCVGGVWTIRGVVEDCGCVDIPVFERGKEC